MADRKPIRIFYSELTRRFYATRAWRELKPGLVEVTGEKFDVTQDIARLIAEHAITFTATPRAIAKLGDDHAG